MGSLFTAQETTQFLIGFGVSFIVALLAVKAFLLLSESMDASCRSLGIGLSLRRLSIFSHEKFRFSGAKEAPQTIFASAAGMIFSVH